MMRSRSCWYAGLTSSSRSGFRRPFVSALLAACGASVSRSRCSSPSRMVDNDVLQEARAMRERADAEVGGERLPEVGECPARPEVRAPLDLTAGKQRGYILARMICAGRARIVAVVCGDHQQVGTAQRGQQPRERLVEAFEVRGVAGHVVAMTVDAVEVHEVDEHEPVRPFAYGGRGPFHAFRLARRQRGERIAGPDATTLTMVGRPVRSSNSAISSEGKPCGNVGNGRSRTMPIISQWHVTESLRGDASAIRP